MRYTTTAMFLLCLFAVSGCVQTRAYIAERARVDQDVQGIPAPAKPKTRQVVVVEFIGGPTAGSEAGGKGSLSRDAVSTEAKSAADAHTDIIPISDPLVPAPAQVSATAVPEQYKVEKDDTLQKISKKLYGSYGKWTKIYDANKDVIKDPNRLKPGITLKIPAI